MMTKFMPFRQGRRVAAEQWSDSPWGNHLTPNIAGPTRR